MEPNTEHFFTELETKWMNAWKNKDREVVQEILADEFTLASSLSNGELMDKQTWIEKALSTYHCSDFRIDKLECKLYGETAVLTVWFWQQATANGKEWNGDFLLTDIWINKARGWQVVARHASWLRK